MSNEITQVQSQMPPVVELRPAPRIASWRTWLKVSRPFSLTATVTPLFVGSALAVRAGHFEPGAFALTFFSCLFLQVGTNYFNEYFDWRYELDTHESLGMSGVIFTNEMRPGQVLGGGVFSFALATGLGLALIALKGPAILLFGLAALATGYFYNARPFKFASRGLGDPLVFLAMGFLMVWGSYWVQLPHWSWAVLAASLPVGCLVTAILNINNIRDYADDKAVNKLTLPVRFGQRFGRIYQHALVLGAFATTTLFAAFGALPLTSLAVWAMLPAALRHLQTVRTATDRMAFRFGTKQVAILHLQFGLLLTAGILAAALFRLPR